ncbi:hypothetical protein HZH66_010098 [Vespula vulgaris]|uniref:Uncharacterized protein n=1 Tax=Vespula vulgaris TaxID=7454 RepID=A0A834JK05_VESVU|nr:hypothetical protein HZH66_010098 [Vespula vulgaris]
MRLGVGEKGGKWELVVGGWVGGEAKEPSVGCNLSCRIRFKIIDPPGGWRIASHYFWTDGNPHREAGLRKIKTRRSLAPDEKFDGSIEMNTYVLPGNKRRVSAVTGERRS